jgi:transposase-like protein
MRRNRRWSVEEKRAAVERMGSCRHAKLAAEIGIPQRQLYSWRKDLERLDRLEEPEGIRGGSREKRLEKENEQLKQALAKKVVEADFLQGVLRRIEARRRPSSGSGETASTDRSE